MKQLAERLEKSLLAIDRLASQSIINEAFSQYSGLEVIETLITPVLEQIGTRWEKGETALSQVYMSSRICEEWLERLQPSRPLLLKSHPPIAIAILDDFHLLGKRIVYSLLRANGYQLLDYGTLGVEQLVERTLGDQLEILLISVLMLPSALQVKQVTQKLKHHPRGERVKVMVGGAPFRFDHLLWQEVGASAMGSVASDALSLLNNWIQIKDPHLEQFKFPQGQNQGGKQ